MNTAIRPHHTHTSLPSRTYRAPLVQRLFMAVGGSVMVGAALFVGYKLSTSPPDLSLQGTLGVWAVIEIAGVGSVLAVIILSTWRVTLSGHAIEMSSWLGGRRLRHDQIAGRRTIDTGKGLSLVIVASAPDLKSITIPKQFFELDAAFSAWFERLRDLDAEDLRASLAEIAANAAFGATPAQRLRRLARARKIARALTAVAIILLLWSLFAPQPYALAIACLALLPVLAVILVVLSKGLFRIGSGSSDSHADLGLACALPSAAIMARTYFDAHMVSWAPLIGAAVLGAGLFIVTIATVERDLHRQRMTFVMIGLSAWAYAFGTLGEANALLDLSPQSVLHSQVLGKEISRGKITSYRLRLAPWGPQQEAGEVRVPSTVYDSLQPGQTACVFIRQGALGMPRFTVLGCPNRGST